MGESTAAAYVIDVLSTLVAMEYMDHGFDKKYSGAARIMLFTGGCLAYYVLYFAKSFFYDGLLVEGLQPGVALAALPLKIPASVFNASVAIIAAPPLALALQAALKRSGLTLRRA